MNKIYLSRLLKKYESMMYPHTDSRFNTKEQIFWHDTCMDIRSPKWSTINRIKQSLDRFDDIYCDSELRVIILYSTSDNILLVKLEGLFGGS